MTETVDAAGNYVVNVYNADGEVVTKHELRPPRRHPDRLPDLQL